MNGNFAGNRSDSFDELLLVILAIVVIAVAGCAPATPEAGESGQENREGALARLLGPETLDITVVEGTPITVRLTTRVSSQSSAVGDTVEGVVAEGVFVDGRLVIPEGSILTGKVTTAEPLGKIGGRASLAFAFTRLTMPDGQQQPIDAGFARVGPSETARDATAIAVGSVVGSCWATRSGATAEDEQSGGSPAPESERRSRRTRRDSRWSFPRARPSA
jgi:hypothetical protein